MTSGKKVACHFSIPIFLLRLIFLLSLSLGYVNSSFLEVCKVFLGKSDVTTSFVVTQIRLPRILACILGGGSLVMSGVLLQTLTKNPLADSGISGINVGAGPMIATMVGLLNVTNSMVIVFMPFLAMLGGTLTIRTVYFVSRQKNQLISPARLIITGVGISSLLSGIMISIIANLDTSKADYIVSWLSGKVSGGNRQTLMILAPPLLVTWLPTYSQSYALNITSLNEETTIVLDLNLKRERFYTPIFSTALAALSVALVGNITFIGLLAGHITRQSLGSDHRISLPSNLSIGMIISLIADTIGCVFLVGTGIPTGLAAAVTGVPYFLYLMIKTV